MGHPEALPRDEVVQFVLSCMHDSGGFGAAPRHDAHMLYTVSAVQILATLDAFDDLERYVPGGELKIAKREMLRSSLLCSDARSCEL